MEIVSDDFWLDVEEPLIMGDCLPILVVRIREIKITDVMAQNSFRPPREGKRILLLAAKRQDWTRALHRKCQVGRSISARAAHQDGVFTYHTNNRIVTTKCD